MDRKLSVGRTAPKQPLRKQKTSRGNLKKAMEDVRFWKNVALSLALSLIGVILAVLLAVLLK